jgi:hypothetical protein
MKCKKLIKIRKYYDKYNKTRTMENQSNSRYYHGDCVCEKKKVPTQIAVECEDCIVDDPLRYENNRREYACNCVDVEIMHEICETCAHDRDQIDVLNDKLDKLMYHIPYDIKKFINCEDKLKEVSKISNEMRHLNRKLLTRLVQPNKEEEKEEENVEEKEEENVEEKVEETPPINLCVNMDCERYPPDWDEEEDTEETYQEDQWQKCNQCDGYFNDDGMGDILYVQEEPNNQEAECDLCGKTEDIVQMKGTGQYLCGNACDEEESEEDEEESEEPSCNEDKQKCETCAININTDNIIELSIEVNGHNLKLCLCDNCFQDKADILRKEGWNHVDNFIEEEEKAKAIVNERSYITCLQNLDCDGACGECDLGPPDGSESDEEEESEGIGCNECYACVTGGSTPCRKKWGIIGDKTNWEIPLVCNEMCKDNM